MCSFKILKEIHMDRLRMNFAFCYPTAPKSNGECVPDSPDGLYRPYFHGELVVEYRKSIASRKPSANAVEAQNHVEEIEEYVEPGTTYVRNLRYTRLK